ncbi:hypothetical protein P167DRAFT_479922 [Morchella conica CCBAS932]|uniref:Tr-type G domain-containing protein n=1 Tax=Morchella conica CCBAS932 TaxID=1392247 RepID=A0A3N4L891_9PEZI|nr:hypothetical protein P167DRAFT_479922 [Morchella conica CCBAS932]
MLTCIIDQLNVGLRKVREILGNEVATDKEIQESLWYYFFDVEKTVNYILKLRRCSHRAPYIISLARALTNRQEKSQKSAPTSAFSGPSPDDVVVAAQSSSKGTLADAKALKKVEAAIQAINIDNAPVKQRKKIDVLQEYKNSTAKENANFVVIGHVDAGKSTLMGRLLLDTGVVDQRTVERFKQEAEKIGKSSFALAWVLDQTEEERSRYRSSMS